VKKPGNSGPTKGRFSGRGLRRVFDAITDWLGRNTEAFNAINVFPVPDGDTGINLYLTMKAAMDETHQADNTKAGVVARAMANGALMGARGNSGVIVSQGLKGFADGLSGKVRFDVSDVAESLVQAEDAARLAVSKPVEGTILSVMKEVTVAVRERAKSGGSLQEVLISAVTAAKEAVANTPNLLPMLREAGVVDAGGWALEAMLVAALHYLRNGNLDGLVPLAIQGPEQSWLKKITTLHEAGGSGLGFCVQFLIIGRGLDVETVREKMLSLGDSVLVGPVGKETLQVHLHTSDKGKAVAIKQGESLGELSGLKVENMQAQAEEFAHQVQMVGEELAPVGTVAVVSGRGLRDVFRGLGVTVIVTGGKTMNPSTEDIRLAIGSCPQDEVLVLPNHSNVIPAAEQAAEQAAKHSKKRVRVIRTRSIPQGVSALIALSLEKGLLENATAVEEAITGVRTVEVTQASRDSSSSGLRIRKGQYIALIDRQLKVVQDTTPEAAVEEALGHLPMGEVSLITLYYGADVIEENAIALAAKIKEKYQHLKTLEVQVVFGGQPLYHYIVSVE